ncbi:hypothetical protein OGATHE_000296 [Ogataea polymorpha]|nr:hypothetical protein OGATHE_000296 [Ogataea polymorpha]
MDFVSYGDQEENVKETKSTVEIAKSKSFYPLALHWLSQDLDLRGERTEDKTRPKYEDLSRLKNDQFYDDKNRVTSYFQTTRHV